MHTKGKLEVVTDCPGKCCWHIQKAGNTDAFNRITSLEMGEEDARRLVACWNTCDGIPTKFIQGGAAGMLEHSKSLARERDELVRALRKALCVGKLKERIDARCGAEAILAKYPEQS